MYGDHIGLRFFPPGQQLEDNDDVSTTIMFPRHALNMMDQLKTPLKAVGKTIKFTITTPFTAGQPGIDNMLPKIRPIIQNPGGHFSICLGID